jgi:hypothetical protein
VLVFRRGKDARSIRPEVYYGLDTMQMATRIANAFNRTHASMVMIDAGGVGGGVVDRLRQLRIPVYEVDFGSKPDGTNLEDAGIKYYNKRAEIWGAVRGWLEEGCISELVGSGYPHSTIDELTGPTYTISSREEIQLEGKKDMRRRGVPSPNWADALACTFAFPTYEPRAGDRGELEIQKPIVAPDYNPFDAARMREP